MRVLAVEGGTPLQGEVVVSGSKNAALPIMAASLLTTEPCRLRNVPVLADVDNAVAILEALGVVVERGGPGEMSLTAAGGVGSNVPLDRARLMRASILFLGPLLARTGEAVVPKPGGDDIGMRRVDQHVFGMRQLGAVVEERDGAFLCHSEGLRGAEIHLDMPTVTGTENIMMAAATAEGRTTIWNAAREPHVRDLAAALSAMGAEISGAGTDRITVEGRPELHGLDHEVVPDYLDAGTYAIATAAVGGGLMLLPAPVEDLRALILKLRHAGVEVDLTPDTIRVRRRGPMRAVDLITWTHPGFATDLQPQFATLMTQAEGTSVIQEFLFENRFHYVPELRLLQASIETLPHGRGIWVHGPTRLHGADITIPDIRAGAALLIAALCAQGTTRLRGVGHLERGYEDMPGKLSRLGCRIEMAADGLE